MTTSVADTFINDLRGNIQGCRFFYSWQSFYFVFIFYSAVNQYQAPVSPVISNFDKKSLDCNDLILIYII